MIYVFSGLISLFILCVLIIAVKNKLDILKLFTDGVIEGAKMVWSIFPYIFAITIAITLIQDTNVLKYILKPIEGVLAKLNVPEVIIPLIAFRPLSGGAATSVVMDILKKCGPDSIEGKMASVIMGGTETTFYVTTILLGAAKIKKTRGIIVAALIADFVAITSAIIMVNVGLI